MTNPHFATRRLPVPHSALSPERRWNEAVQRLEGAYAPDTLRAYQADVARFLAWCSAAGRSALPASPATLVAFIAEEARLLKPASLQRRLHGIRKAHRLLGLADPTASEEAQLALRRALRTAPQRPQQARGLSAAHLSACLAALPDTPWGLRNRALLSLGYDLLARRSELAALRSDDIALRADGTLRVLVRRSKTDPYGLGRIAFTSRRSAALVGAWLGWRDSPIEALFCPIYQGTAIDRYLGTNRIRQIIAEAVGAASIAPSAGARFSGHSLRVGAAQDLLQAGHDSAAIMRAGGWKSLEALSRYLELAEHNVWATA